MADRSVMEITDRALDGQEITKEEIAKLLSTPVFSEESAYIRYVARKMSEETSGGLAEVHGQVGVNVGPCPKNCAFCSFAASNGVFKEHKVATVEEVIEKCLAFEQAGANAVYLMSTVNLDFTEFIRMAKIVRNHLQPETVLIANTGDFNYQQALALKEAGFAGIYHAVRLGEGKVTAISIQNRLKTLQAAREAGLLIGTCVEPVGPEHSIDELVEKTLLTREAQPVFSGAARRIPIPGTRLSAFGMASEARMAHILAVVRLAMGYGVPGNCTHEPNVIGAAAGANLLWAEMGSNPRDTNKETENNRGYSVERCREIFKEAEWQVLNGPSKMFNVNQ